MPEFTKKVFLKKRRLSSLFLPSFSHTTQGNPALQTPICKDVMCRECKKSLESAFFAGNEVFFNKKLLFAIILVWSLCMKGCENATLADGFAMSKSAGVRTMLEVAPEFRTVG
ncbi:MAG TPA: hypothetical protein VJ654_00810 [Noviherbaspirillum sp.]|nr:hypothetical protein [Noviherbaspirillum sp.]